MGAPVVLTLREGHFGLSFALFVRTRVMRVKIAPLQTHLGDVKSTRRLGPKCPRAPNQVVYKTL